MRRSGACSGVLSRRSFRSRFASVITAPTRTAPLLECRSRASRRMTPEAKPYQRLLGSLSKTPPSKRRGRPRVGAARVTWRIELSVRDLQVVAHGGDARRRPGGVDCLVVLG